MNSKTDARPTCRQSFSHHPRSVETGFGGAYKVLRHRHFSPYKVFVARQKRTVVVLNPKVGTTSFRHMLARAHCEVLGRRDPSAGRYPFVKKAREFPFAPARDYFHAFAQPGEYEFFCFVRNPYARLKSAWVDKFAFGHESIYPRSIRGALIRRVRCFAGENNLPGSETNSPLPFPTFVAYVDSQSTGQRNHHWDEQYSLLLFDHIRYRRVFRMETDFVEGAKTILARLGIDEKWTQAALDEPQNQSPKHEGAIFTEELAKRAQRIFARDFEIFDYDIDSWKGL